MGGSECATLTPGPTVCPSLPPRGQGLQTPIQGWRAREPYGSCRTFPLCRLSRESAQRTRSPQCLCASKSWFTFAEIRIPCDAHVPGTVFSLDFLQPSENVETLFVYRAAQDRWWWSWARGCPVLTPSHAADLVGGPEGGPGPLLQERAQTSRQG